VVFWVGVTFTLPESLPEVENPVPEHDESCDAVHDRVEDCPAVIDDGDAPNEVITLPVFAVEDVDPLPVFAVEDVDPLPVFAVTESVAVLKTPPIVSLQVIV